MALQSCLTSFRKTKSKLTVSSIMEYRRQYGCRFKWNKDHLSFEENFMTSITNNCFPLQFKNAGLRALQHEPVLHTKSPLSQDIYISIGDFQIGCRLSRLKILKFSHRSIQNSSSDKMKSPLIVILCIPLKMGSQLHPLISFSHSLQKKL